MFQDFYQNIYHLCSCRLVVLCHLLGLPHFARCIALRLGVGHLLS